MTIDDLFDRLREGDFEERFVADPERVAEELGFDLQQKAASAARKGFTARWTTIRQGTFVCFYADELIGVVYIPT